MSLHFSSINFNQLPEGDLYVDCSLKSKAKVTSSSSLHFTSFGSFHPVQVGYILYARASWIRTQDPIFFTTTPKALRHSSAASLISHFGLFRAKLTSKGSSPSPWSLHVVPSLLRHKTTLLSNHRATSFGRPRLDHSHPCNTQNCSIRSCCKGLIPP